MNHDELRKAAEAATPGPWRTGWAFRACAQGGDHHPRNHRCKYVVNWVVDEHPHEISNEQGEPICGNYDYEEGGVVHPEDARYIATASPDVVLSLLAEIDQLKAALVEIAPAPDPMREKHYITQGTEHAWYVEEDATCRPVPGWTCRTCFPEDATHEQFCPSCGDALEDGGCIDCEDATHDQVIGGRE